MAESKKSNKKNKGKKVDTILIVLIAILVLAIIALGIVLAMSMKESDVIEPEVNSQEVTDSINSYSEYLNEQMKSIGSLDAPITSRLVEGQTSNYTNLYLSLDNNVYLISETSNPDVISDGGIYSAGNKVELDNVVNVFEVGASDKLYIFALTVDGKIYSISLIDGSLIEYKSDYDIVEVDSEGATIIGITLDGTRSVLTAIE